MALTLRQALLDVLCKYQCLEPSHEPMAFPILQLRKSRHRVKLLAQVHIACALWGVLANILVTGKALLITCPAKCHLTFACVLFRKLGIPCNA